MDVYGVNIPYRPLTNFDLCDYAKKLGLEMRGVFMRDNLPPRPLENEYSIVNLNKSNENGSHWVCYFKKGDTKTYFDSFGQTVLQEIRDYLKSPIFRNTDVIQPFNTPICGHLCLYVLKSLDRGMTFRDTLNSLEKIGGEIEWSSPLADELHRPVRKHFPKRYVFVRKANEIFGADLVDMRALSKQNKGYKYILMVIDIFSKYGWAIPLKFKTGVEVSQALQTIFKERTPQRLWVDLGTEFYNSEVKKLLLKHKITM